MNSRQHVAIGIATAGVGLGIAQVAGMPQPGAIDILVGSGMVVAGSLAVDIDHPRSFVSRSLPLEVLRRVLPVLLFPLVIGVTVALINKDAASVTVFVGQMTMWNLTRLALMALVGAAALMMISHLVVNTLGHRGPLHSLLFAAGIAGVSILASDVVADEWWWGLCFCWGWTAHVLADGLTSMGVPLLWPLSRSRIRLMPRIDPLRPVRRALRLALLALLIAVSLLSLAIAFFYVYDALGGVNEPYVARDEPRPEFPELGVEWQMHLVDNPGDWLPNGLDAADVNGDGYADYVTNYEFRGLIRVAFHPGAGLTGGEPWPAVDAGRVPNAESAAFGDLDGDGHPDILVAHGIEHTAEQPGVRVLWGAPPGDGGYSWVDGGDIPASAGGWQFLYVQATDLDGDGDQDVVAGGRASRIAGGSRDEVDGADLIWAGLRWFENPGPGARDLGLWAGHVIDPDTRSGHGFEFGDLDGDGDLDLVHGNADWDTPDDEEAVVWYENPGLELAGAWARHEIYRGPEFYGKEQVVVVDLDGDGLLDVLTQTEDDVYWFRSTGGEQLAFELIVIPKHPAARWRARALEVADLNNDGSLDIVAAAIHRDGTLPKDQAALFWMERVHGEWVTHVIKWGDGFWGLGTFNGEKWDQIIPYDVDGDGDLDLVANCEEYNRLRTIVAVVWFENPLIER